MCLQGEEMEALLSAHISSFEEVLESSPILGVECSSALAFMDFWKATTLYTLIRKNIVDYNVNVEHVNIDFPFYLLNESVTTSMAIAMAVSKTREMIDRLEVDVVALELQQTLKRKFNAGDTDDGSGANSPVSTTFKDGKMEY